MPIAAAQAFLEEETIRNGRMLLAISGGLDSRVLLDAMSRLAPERGIELALGHVNHQLRGEASEGDADFVEGLGREHGVPVLQRRVEPEALRVNQSSRLRPTLEEAARTLRRSALLEMADAFRADWIATAHHAGDQAETLLLRLFRGTGPDGLRGIAPRSEQGRVIRPLLHCLPEAIRAHAEAHSLDWREDDSNSDRAFSRNRLRRDWIPGIQSEFNPQLLRTLSNLADTYREEAEWIEDIVDAAAENRISTDPNGVGLALDGWADLPAALARRLVRRALVAVGLERDLSRQHILRVLEFMGPGRSVGRDKRLELPRGIELRREDQRFRLRSSLEAENATMHRRK